MKLLTLPKISDPRGNLTFLQEKTTIPFEIARTYWIYDVPAGEIRGSNAFKQQQIVLIVLSGSVDVVIHDGLTESRIYLGRSDKALLIPPFNWRRLENFSTNTVCLFISSHGFDEGDYIRDFEEFLTMRLDSQKPSLFERGPGRTFELERQPTIYDVAVIELSQLGQRNGHITITEGIKDIPFDVKRIFYIYDIPSGSDRGAHAHRLCHQFLVAVSGSFEVQLDDGRNKRTIRLERPNYGLHIPPGIWAAEHSFSGGSVCLVLTSQYYNEDDYIRNYIDYLEYLSIIYKK